MQKDSIHCSFWDWTEPFQNVTFRAMIILLHPATQEKSKECRATKIFFDQLVKRGNFAGHSRATAVCKATWYCVASHLHCCQWTHCLPDLWPFSTGRLSCKECYVVERQSCKMCWACVSADKSWLLKILGAEALQCFAQYTQQRERRLFACCSL